MRDARRANPLKGLLEEVGSEMAASDPSAIWAQKSQTVEWQNINVEDEVRAPVVLLLKHSSSVKKVRHL